MRSAKRLLEFTSNGRTFRKKDPTTCDHRNRGLLKQTSRTVLDDSGFLAITAWTCSKCGGIIEEVYILARDGKTRARPARFAVSPSPSNRWAGQIAHSGLTN